jgi:hypothetical protein
MKLHMKKLSILMIFVVGMMLSSCEKELYENAIHQTKSGKITLDDFKRETGISEVDPIKKLNIGAENSRTIEEDYYINTEEILKYISENSKVTYTFKILPINKELDPKEYYNLVYEKLNNEWNQIVFKNTEKQNPLPNDPKLESSEMIYNQKGGSYISFSIAAICEQITYTVSCDGSCGSNQCDGFSCSTGQCIQTTVTYYYCDSLGGSDNAGDYNFNGIVGNSGSGNNGANNGYVGVFVPNPYSDTEVINSEIMPLGWRLESFKRYLETYDLNYLPIYNLHTELRDYLVINNCNITSQQFVIDFIAYLISLPENPISFKSFIIEKQIDDSQLDDCSKGILNKLKQNHAIAKIIQRFDNPNTPFTTTFSQVPNLVGENGVGIAIGKTSPTATNFVYNIQLNSNYFKDDGATKLLKAKTIVHELIHALIMSVIQNSGNSNSTDLNDFPEIWDEYVVQKLGSSNVNTHVTMGNHYVNIIASAIQEFDTGTLVTDVSQIQQLYKDLAWSGIVRLTATTTPFDSVLTSADKARIGNRLNTELSRSTDYGMTPSSNNPCAP